MQSVQLQPFKVTKCLPDHNKSYNDDDDTDEDEWMISDLGHDSALVRLYWAGVNLLMRMSMKCSYLYNWLVL